MGADVEDASAFFARSLIHTALDARPAAVAGAIVDTLRHALAPHAKSDGVYLGAAAWLATART